MIPPESSLNTWRELVDRSERIALAEVTAFESVDGYRGGVYQFQILEVLKGEIGQNFEFEVSCCGPASSDSDFTEHLELGFWVGYHTKMSEVPPKIGPFVHLYRFAKAVSGQILSFGAFYQRFPPYPGSGFIRSNCDVGFTLELGGQ